MNDSMLKVGGKPFYCSCGANVFHKGNKPGLWVCNGCGTEYADETYDSRETNADCIRAMSDEELAWELMTWRLDAVARNHGIEGVYPDTQKEILKWLQSPTEEDT